MTGVRPNATWSLNNNEDLPPHVEIKGNTLQIRGVSVEDGALYVCEVRSLTGIARSIAQLIVKGMLYVSVQWKFYFLSLA